MIIFSTEKILKCTYVVGILQTRINERDILNQECKSHQAYQNKTIYTFSKIYRKKIIKTMHKTDKLDTGNKIKTPGRFIVPSLSVHKNAMKKFHTRRLETHNVR